MLNWITINDPDTGRFKIVEVPCFDLEGVSKGNTEFINKSSLRVIQLFNQKYICRYPHPHKFVFEKISNFKRYLINFLKEYYITPVFTLIKYSV